MTAGGRFEGTATFVRAGLKRDRIILPVAILALVGWAVLYPIQYETYFPTPESIETAVRLSARYVTDRRLPDKALDLLSMTHPGVAK